MIIALKIFAIVFIIVWVVAILWLCAGSIVKGKNMRGDF